MKEKAVIILSGGMDSVTLLYDILSRGYDVFALSVNYGQKHSKELVCAKNICKKLNIEHIVLDLSMLSQSVFKKSALTSKETSVPDGYYNDENMKQTVVPNRNMVLLSLATGYAISIGATKIFYGAHAGDHDIYPDCRSEFVDAMKKVIELADWAKVELNAPYLNITKKEILEIGFKLNVDYSNTWTCYKGGEKACGVCGSCQERLEAFNNLNIKDPLDYESK
ncbi:MAG: 7-cyano-7-deazaguanine synthase QueC [Spirochaetes bacterium GWC1_27_15]|nr:MAG: 7-cyano-7-deazaguanine synthase QueC [Spirochaetes bacterium GWC1_27_15]